MPTDLVRVCVKSVCLLILMLLSVPLAAASLDDLAPHRAIYNLQLERADDKTGISHLSGRMVYEFSGARCEGFTTRFRYVSRIGVEDNALRLHDQQTTLFESGDGQTLRITNKNYVNRELTDEFEAQAQQEEKEIVVDVTKPEIKKHHLPRALFPIAQMVEMMQKAENGQKFYQTALYDDFENGDKITQATVIIGAQRTHVGSYTPVWPVSVSYFDDVKNPDGLPSYSNHFLLDNLGISHDIVFDYGDFSMRGTLIKLDILATPPCPD